MTVEERYFFFIPPHPQISFSISFLLLALSQVFIEHQPCARHCIGYMWGHRDEEGIIPTLKELIVY